MSSADLTPDAIAEITRVTDAATPGPWDTSWKYGNTKTERYCVLGPTRYADPIATTTRYDQGNDDAEFIALARTAIPDLLAALTAKDEEIARLRAEHQELREIILAWWNDPDNPPVGAARLARIESETP